MTDKKWTFASTGQSGNPNVLTHTGSGQLLPGQTVTFTMSAPPGSRVSVAIDHRVNVPLMETSAGVFTGSYVVRNTDIFANDPVGARVIPPAGRQYLVQAFQPFGYTSASVTGTVPVITSPLPSDRVSDPLIVQGIAPPNSTVQVHVSYSTSLLGVLPMNGSVADVTAFSDASGNFVTRPISLGGFIKGGNTSYTITAVTLLPNGSRSNATTLTVRQ